MNDLDKALDGLVRRTTDGKLQWVRSVASNEFVASIDSISVIIRDTSERSVFGSGHHQLAILGDSGDVVAVLPEFTPLGAPEAPDARRATPERSRQLAQLYNAARRSALNTEATLDKLVKALAD